MSAETEYKRAEGDFIQMLKDGKGIDMNRWSKLILNDMLPHLRFATDDVYFGKYRLKEIFQAIEFPQEKWQILLAVSETLMHISTYYYRLNMMFANMAVFEWGVTITHTAEKLTGEAIKAKYFTVCQRLEKMHLAHEFSKIMRKLPYRDVFCGLVFENTSDFFIHEIPFRVCRLYEVEDGLYNFIIDLNAIKGSNIAAYPAYVQKAFSAYAEQQPGASRWYYPPSDKQVCIKLNEQWIYPFPMLIGLLRDLADLDVFKKLKLQNARTGNYKAIAQKVPIDEKTVDKPLLTPTALGLFAEINQSSLSDDIGLLYTVGGDAKEIEFEANGNADADVDGATNQVYSSAGVTKELFNGSSSGTAVTLSVENNAGFVYAVYRQFERWVNRFIKLRRFSNSNIEFQYYLLDCTIFNRDNVAKRYREAATLGAPVVDRWLASLGMTPNQVVGAYKTHEIFDYYNKFKPLQSTYNTADPGRPTAEELGETLSESGEATRDSDANMDR